MARKPTYKELEQRIGALESEIDKRKQAEKASREREKRFCSVVETANDAIITIDHRGDIVSWNHGAHVMFGYSIDEIEGQTLTRIMPEQYREDHQNGLRRVASGGASKIFGTTVELAGLRKDGSEFPMELSIASWKSGGEVLFTAIIRDITKRKWVEIEITRLATVIEQAAVTVVITDLKGDIVYANPDFETSTGYTVAEVLGQNPRILKSDRQDALFYHELWGTVTAGRVWNGVFVNKCKDGGFYHEQATIFPIRNTSGEIINYAAVKRDISNQVRTEEELRKAKESAEAAPYPLNPETLKRLPEIVQLLETELMLRWGKLNEMLIMDDVKQFADDLKRIGREYRFTPLTEFGDCLSDCVKTYDIGSIKNNLAEFPKIIERLKIVA